MGPPCDHEEGMWWKNQKEIILSSSAIAWEVEGTWNNQEFGG